MQNGFALLLVLLSTLAFGQADTPERPKPPGTQVELPAPVPDPIPQPPTENSNQTKLKAIKNITRFAFGSCNNQNSPQPLWADMLMMKPDLFLWGGDIIYADWETRYDIKTSYEKQKNQPDYAKVREQMPIIGMWDDHDFSWNDADGNNPEKKTNQQLVLDFLDESADSPRRTQDGIYTSYQFGEEGKQVKFILLDNRYFKNLDPNAPYLGEKQWQWLEEEFRTSSAQVHFIMAGLSVFSPLLPYSEEWWHHPNEVNRMLALVKKYQPKGLMFLTGDKHFGTIFKSYGQLEMISSGMTHVIDSRSWWYLGRKYPVTWFGLNYGLIDIEWEGTTPLITTRFRSTDHRDIHKFKYRWGNNTWDQIRL